jgi:hypothetical protein
MATRIPEITFGGNKAMTKKHFTLIAMGLRASTGFAVYKRSLEARTQHALMCSQIAEELQAVFPAFDRMKFLRVCGLPQSVAEAL